MLLDSHTWFTFGIKNRSFFFFFMENCIWPANIFVYWAPLFLITLICFQVASVFEKKDVLPRLEGKAYCSKKTPLPEESNVFLFVLKARELFGET